jgi:GntR family transcriptional regulator
MARAFLAKRDVYLEIAERYEKYITLGVLKVGDRLPSVRVAAGELGVNPNTVQRAYTLLEERGFIHTIPKKGVFVTFGEEGADNDELRCEAVGAIVRLKEMGATREELSRIIEEVYAND